MREKLSCALTSSNLKQSEFDCAVDKVHALGIASIGNSIGSDLIHFADALQPKAHNQLLDGLAKASAKRFKCERTMLVKLCKLAIHENIFRFCQGCGGAKQQQGENKIIICQTCAGTGIHRHTDEGRALALELTQDAYQKGWNNRLQKVQEILSEKVQNTTRLAAKKYHDEEYKVVSQFEI